MIARAVKSALVAKLALGLVLALAAPASAQYRGMAPGWPHYAAGQYSAHYAPATYPQQYAAPQYAAHPYYAARPVAAPARYAPVTAAYANPAYFGAYNAPASYVQRPATTAYYAPPTSAYYAPTTAGYGPTGSYSVSPAGGSSAGAEAYPGYGQPTNLNYVPPRFVYRTTYAQVPVYAYRPVTVYDPVTAQPVTCLQPAPTTQCQTQRKRWFSHSWFSWFRPSCGSGGCGAAPPPTTSYCTSNYCQPAPAPCGAQPYYPAQPTVIIPSVPAPGVVVPGASAPGSFIPPAGATIPSPPTRFGPGGLPADNRPSLPPGGFVPRNPAPSTTFPGTGSGGSFPVDPSAPAGSGFVPAAPGGGFSTGGNYPPASDPYTSSSAPIRAPQARSAAPAPTAASPIVRGPSLAPGVQAIPDPEAQQPTKTINRAPQLLDPRDKSARAGDLRWAVVPAVWPKKSTADESPYRVYHERSLSETRASAPPAAPAVNADQYDDSGWQSAR